MTRKLSLIMFIFSLSGPIRAELATFAGGCFWCMQPPFDKLKGVIKTTVGFSGGSKKDPSYKQVSSGQTKHREVVQVEFNPTLIKYKRLLEVFWRSCDPTDPAGQFADRGLQYTTAIFYHSEKQKKVAEASKKSLQQSKRFKKPIVTPILPYQSFHPAEDYHQNYYKKNPLRYKTYRYLSGRDKFIEKNWGK